MEGVRTDGQSGEVVAAAGTVSGPVEDRRQPVAMELRAKQPSPDSRPPGLRALNVLSSVRVMSNRLSLPSPPSL